jgi:hypothetical protein
VAHLQHCSKCGAVALHLGPVTLRFDAAALESLWNVIGQALAQLREERDEAERPWPQPAGRA